MDGKPKMSSIDGGAGKASPQKKKGRSCLLPLILLGAFCAMLGAAFMIANHFGTRAVDNDPYMQANDFYKNALSDYKRGDLKSAAAKLNQALDLQKLPPDKIATGAPPVQANAVTLIASGLLSIISAKLGDCASYWKYRNMTQQISGMDWTYVYTDQITKQGAAPDGMIKKEQVVRDAAVEIVKIEYACPSRESKPVATSAAPRAEKKKQAAKSKKSGKPAGDEPAPVAEKNKKDRKAAKAVAAAEDKPAMKTTGSARVKDKTEDKSKARAKDKAKDKTGDKKTSRDDKKSKNKKKDKDKKTDKSKKKVKKKTE